MYLYGLDIIAEQLAGAERYYYVHDGLGSVRQALDSTGQIATRCAYDPFGVLLSGDGVSSPWQFTGEAWDAEVELLYLRARYYHPGTRRYMTKDPWPGNIYSPVTMHPYRYMANRPVTWVDPTGLQDDDEETFPKDWTYYVTAHPNYWRLQRREQPRALAWAASLPWRVVPDNYCLPGDLGCWGGARYGEWVETLNLYQLGYLYAPQAPWLPTARVQGLSRGQHDVTPWLVQQLNTNTRAPIGCALRQYYPWPGAWIGWTQLVRGGGIWDFKPDFKWQELWSITICGKWCAFDVPANIHFGYAGRSVGFTPLQLRAGAGAAQVLDNIVKPISGGQRPNWDAIGPAALFYDEPGDVTAILIGMELYDRHGDQVTEQELCAVVDRYTDPPAPLKPLHPGQPQY